MVEVIGGDEFGEVRTANLDITLVKPNQRKVTQRQWEDRVIKDMAAIPDARIHFNRNGNGRDINIYITGDDPQLVEASARKLVEEMRQLPILRDAGHRRRHAAARRSSSIRTSTWPRSWASRSHP